MEGIKRVGGEDLRDLRWQMDDGKWNGFGESVAGRALSGPDETSRGGVEVAGEDGVGERAEESREEIEEGGRAERCGFSAQTSSHALGIVSPRRGTVR
jgi:hypothetical protein